MDQATEALLPAPWSLTGSGYILALRPPGDTSETFLDASLAASRRGSMAWVIFADYTTADCGPYHELLYIPGTCAFGERRLLTISRIFVSTEVSVVNGQRNWGIPKERADFDVTYGEDGIDRVRVSIGGRDFAKLELRAFGPRLPISTVLVPESLRTLGQEDESQRFIYAPSAKGRVRPARLLSGWTDVTMFPDVSPATTRFAIRADPFAMTFPVAAQTRIRG